VAAVASLDRFLSIEAILESDIFAEGSSLISSTALGCACAM
jgi:hypothetical protein